MDQQKQHSEEIDLVDLVNRIVKNTVAGLKAYARILWNNRLLFTVIFLAVALAGFLTRYLVPRYFKTTGIFVAHYMPANMYGFLINDLSGLAADGKNSGVLAEQLKIPEKSAASIHAIETQTLNAQDFQYKNDTTAVNPFRIILTLSDISALQDIQNGLKTFLENNEYSEKRKMARKKTLDSIKADLTQNIKSLDSLQQMMNKPAPPQHSGQVIVMAQSFTPIEAFKMQQDYKNRKLQVDRELDMVQSVEIVQPFTKMAAKNSPDINRYFKFSLVAALVLALLITPVFGKRR